MGFFKVKPKTMRRMATVSKVGGAATVVGVGAAAVTGALPGTEGFSEGIGSIAGAAGDVLVSGLEGVSGVFQNLPLLLAGGAGLALLVLLKS